MKVMTFGFTVVDAAQIRSRQVTVNLDDPRHVLEQAEAIDRMYAEIDALLEDRRIYAEVEVASTTPKPDVKAPF